MSTRQQSTRLQSNRLLHIFVYSYKLVYAIGYIPLGGPGACPLVRA